MKKHKYSDSYLEQEALMKEQAKELLKDKKEILIGEINLGGKIMSHYYPRRYYKGKCKVVIYRNDCEFPCFHLISEDGTLHLPIRIYEAHYDDYQHIFDGELNRFQRKRLDKWLSSPSLPNLGQYSASVWDDIRILWDMNNDTDSLYYRFKKTYIKPDYNKLTWKYSDYIYSKCDVDHRDWTQEELGFIHENIAPSSKIVPHRHTESGELHIKEFTFSTDLGDCELILHLGEWAIPHFHIESKNKHDFKCCIRINEPYYYSHGGKYNDVLSDEERKELIEVLNSKDDLQFSDRSVWDQLKISYSYCYNELEWEDEFVKYENEVDSIPDYSKLSSFKNTL